MAFRFWRRIKIAPGVTLNLSKSGGSLSFGPRGAKFTIGPRGRRATVGIPGTGLFYTATDSGRRTGAPGNVSTAVPSVHSADRLTLGFFKRLITPDDEEALVDGCRELVAGNEAQALHYLKQAAHLADGAYLTGFLYLKREQTKEAADYLASAAEKHRRLGSCFSKYGISAIMSLPITDEVSAHVGPNLQGVLLGLVEVCQRQKRIRKATESLERLRRLDPEDLVVNLSLAELLLDSQPDDKNVCRRIVRLAGDIKNETSIHAALLLYKGRALRRLGLTTAARDVLTAALRRKKDRSRNLLLAIRYERAQVYTELNQESRARTEFEKLYAEEPDYEDVAKRLGL